MARAGREGGEIMVRLTGLHHSQRVRYNGRMLTIQHTQFKHGDLSLHGYAHLCCTVSNVGAFFYFQQEAK